MRTLPDEGWSEIEALLTAPSQGRRRFVRPQAVRRAVAGVAVVIATGGLALASVGVLSRVCDGRCSLETAGSRTATSPTLAMASQPRVDATIAEGRSIAAHGAAPAVADRTGPHDASPDRLASTAPAADDALRDSAVQEPPSHRGRHRHRHRDRAGLAYREAGR